MQTTKNKLDMSSSKNISENSLLVALKYTMTPEKYEGHTKIHSNIVNAIF